MTILQEHHLTFKLKGNYHQIARQFATQQDISEKAKKVYLNTLAVCTVKTFIEELSFETILEKSLSWDPIFRSFEDVADLVVSELGRVECLFVIGEEDSVTLPKEVRQGRIAYIVVRFQEVLNEAQLLGFYPCPDQQVNSENIKVSELEPIEALIDYLFSLELENNNILKRRNYLTLETSSVSETTKTERVHLGQWLRAETEELVEEVKSGWLKLEELLSIQPRLAYGFRSTGKSDSVQRGKLYDLGIRFDNRLLALLVTLKQETNNTITAKVQMRPADNLDYLPPQLKLAALSESGEKITEAVSRDKDNIIQLVDLKEIESGEQFIIQITLDEFTIRENFLVDF
jgi:hypothetical protein